MRNSKISGNICLECEHFIIFLAYWFTDENNKQCISKIETNTDNYVGKDFGSV